MRTIMFACLVVLSVQSMAQKAAGLYKIYDTRAKKEISIDELVIEFGRADVLFFGEEHDDSIGHILEAEIFERSHKATGDKLALSMEMFERDVQLVLDEYLAGLIAEKNLVKEGRAWKNYNDYKQAVEYAKANKLPVIAANTPQRYTNAVTKNGLQILEKFSPQWLPPLPIDTATGRYYERFAKVMGGHSAMPGLHIYQSQNLWDASMAWSIHSFLKKNKGHRVMHLNGRFHTDEKGGIIAQLNKYSKNRLNILNISCFYLEDISAPDWSKYAALGDFVIVTHKLKDN
jgi:uncharacterized iron-regulated protein